MKHIVYFVVVLMAAALLLSCESMAEGAMSGAMSSIGMGSVPAAGAAAGNAAAVAEFQSGEILCSADTRPMTDSSFRVAKVLTPASSATKNQSEVLWISDGNKEWVNYVVGSRKAVKEDLVVGAPVFYLMGWAQHDEIDADSYRKSYWGLDLITSTEELYKNNVEVAGDLYNINYLRVPTDPVK